MAAPRAAPVTEQPYAVRFSAPAAKVLATLPEHVEDMVWDALDAAAGEPRNFRTLSLARRRQPGDCE
ncbi:hypothetical protein [Streptomyces sp. NPDC088254]|uniref:hypothetical protein n=1 Tax=Streptomyces sp. NPDC088254 TaxID=3365847 RepID=UPI0037F38B8B